MKWYRLSVGDRITLAVDGRGGYWDLSRNLESLGLAGSADPLMALFHAGDDARRAVTAAAWAVSGRGPDAVRQSNGPTFISSGDAKELAPIRRPGKIMGIGRNYLDHCKEQNVEPPKHPTVFAKWPQCVVGPGDAVAHPPTTKKLDYEGELAVVIGKGGRHANEDSALSWVFGYTIANDVTARDLQQLDGQWVRAKSGDGFCPLGPCILSADQVPDPQDLRIVTSVEGEKRQDESTGQMIFSVATLIAFVSASFALEPGDLILTGTPAGVGANMKPPKLLQPGQRVAIEIEGIGRLENHIVAE